MVRARRQLALLALLAAAACAPALVETPEQATERRAMSCLDAGFARNSDAYKVCLLLERQNDRMADMERRLGIIETQTIHTGPPIYPWRGYW